MSFKFDPKRIDKVMTKRVEAVLASGNSGILPITQMGESVLRQICPKYKGGLEPALLNKLIQAMKVTMHDAPGVGLAGPQIGLNIPIAVLEDPSVDEDYDPISEEDVHETYHLPFFVILNPSYEPLPPSSADLDGEPKTKADDDEDVVETRIHYEGCLSFSGYYAARERYHRIGANWTDEKGRDHSEVLQGWPARIFQHETDHLYGEVYIDKAYTRSLTTAKNLKEFDLDDDIEWTADALGFDLTNSNL